MTSKRPLEHDEAEPSPRPQQRIRSLRDLPDEDYTIAWICALPSELWAARAMLDDEHHRQRRRPGDQNEYVVGRIGLHNVVMTCLPGEYGKINAAKVSTDLKTTFRSIEATLMVGIAGGAPSQAADLRLGDVVVGTGVVEYDLGKALESGNFVTASPLKRPSPLLRAAVAMMQSKERRPGHHQHGPCSGRMVEILKTRFPDDIRPPGPDLLFQPDYPHSTDAISCDDCEASGVQIRTERLSTTPWMYHGVVASGDIVMKDAAKRDLIARQTQAICFEMEAAAMMDNLHCLPIRGICDYSDSHKNKEWQIYAAAAAASCARELLEALSPFHVGYRAQSIPHDVPTAGQSPSPPSAKVLERRQRLIESLSFPRINARRNAIKQMETCNWFLDIPEYQHWLGAEQNLAASGFFWIHGKAGAGKSTIMKFLDARARKNKHVTTVVISFFFNARGDILEKSIDGMYRSLLFQVLHAPALEDLKSILDDTDVVPLLQDGCPDRDALKELLSNAVRGLGQRSLTCYIDALDECDENDVRDMVEFFRMIAGESPKLRICFSSRPYPRIELEPNLILEREVGHKKDLEQYVTKNLIAPNRLRDDLQHQIIQKAAGVFMWVVLVVEILNEETRNGVPNLNLRQKLERIPAQLSQLFKDMLTRDQKRPEDLKLCILWVLCAKRPLTTTELRHAIWANGRAQGQFESFEDLTEGTDEQSSINFAISSSKGLLEVDRPTANRPVLQFIHESVRDFLIKDRGVQQIWPEMGEDWEAKCHDILMNCCRAYLTHPTVRDFIHPFVSGAPGTQHDIFAPNTIYAFLKYASQHILHHANQSATKINQQPLLSWFFNTYGAALLDGNDDKCLGYEPHANPLYVFARRGLANLVRSSVGHYPDLYDDRLIYKCPLFAAFVGSHHDTVIALLGLTATMLETQEWTEELSPKRGLFVVGFTGRTPLSWAAQEGRLALMKVLIAKGASTTQRDPGGETPLTRAAASGSIEAMRLLIDLGVTIRFHEYGPYAMVCNALIKRHHEVAWCLLTHPEAKASPEWFSDHHVSEWLYYSTVSNMQDVVRFLCDKAPARSRSEALVIALHRKLRGVASILVDHGAVLLQGEMVNSTSLVFAARTGNTALVKTLIQQGAILNARDQFNCTAYDYALRNGSEEILQLLHEAAEALADGRHGDDDYKLTSFPPCL